MMAANLPPDQGAPGPALALARSVNASIYVAGNPAPPLAQMDFNTLAPVGGGLPHNNLMPYLTLNFCIAMQGVYPPRS